MKKASFIFALHGIVFSIFMIVNMIINDYVYTFLTTVLNQAWLVAVVDFVVSGVLYVAIYTVVYYVYKLIVINVKKEVINLRGSWLCLHVKRDREGNIKPNCLRPGQVEISQDLYDVSCQATNKYFKLDEDGTLDWVDDAFHDTVWNSYSIDWDGKENIVMCFKAITKSKNDVNNLLDNNEKEGTDRYGIHDLKINAKGDKMLGTFADTYPSANNGEIYFFKNEKDFLKFIRVHYKENCANCKSANLCTKKLTVLPQENLNA